MIVLEIMAGAMADLVASEMDRVHARIAGRLGVLSPGPGAGVSIWAGRGTGTEERPDVGGAGG
jgi:hypothetical protein